MTENTQHIIQLLLLSTGGLLLAARVLFRHSLGTLAKRVMLGTLVVVSLISTAAYTRFGGWHEYGEYGNHSYHYHDIYHYVIGSKYYSELGYERLYDCTWVAFEELKEDGIAVPPIKRLRALRNPDKAFDPVPRRNKLMNVCHDNFSPSRWQEFKGDVGVWLDQGWVAFWWQVLLGDLGFNPPPTWTVIGGSLANLLPISAFTLEAMPFIDLFLIYVVGGAMVWRAFGPWALAGFLIVFGNNWLASYRWTGGSFCRQLWFASLIYGVCLLQMRRYASAGVALALACTLRVFPLVFVAGALWALIREARQSPQGLRNLKRFSIAGLLTAAVMVVASLVLYDLSLWPRFFHKMSHHGNTFFMWHVGFKKWAVFYPELLAESKVRIGHGAIWASQGFFNRMYADHRLQNELLRGSMIVAAAAATFRRPPAEAAMVLGGVLLFCLSIPANYYYVYLALLPAIFVVRGADKYGALRVGLVFLALISVSISPWMQTEPLWQNAWINQSMLAFFIALIASYGLGSWGRDRVEE